MSRTKARRRVHPAVAVVGLLVCGGIAANSLLGALRPAGSSAAGGPPGDGDVPAEGEAGGAADAKAWRDLLAVHGSFDEAIVVPMAFAPAAEGAWAAPAGETAGGPWVGDDPPLLRLGVVMVSAGSRRAVLGGCLAGIGETVAGVRVTSIEPGRVHVLWRGRPLTYDLEGEAPREFRAELARRGARTDAATDGGGAEPSAPVAKKQKKETGS